MDRAQFDQIIQKTGDDIGPYAAVQVAKIIRSVVAPGKPPSTLKPGQTAYSESLVVLHPKDFRDLLPQSKGARRFAKRLAARR